MWTGDWRRQLKINSVHLCSVHTEFSVSVLKNHTRMKVYFSSLHLAKKKNYISMVHEVSSTKKCLSKQLTDSDVRITECVWQIVKF